MNQLGWEYWKQWLNWCQITNILFYAVFMALWHGADSSAGGPPLAWLRL